MNDYDLWLKEMNISDKEAQLIMAELDVNHLLNTKSKIYHKNKSKIHGIGLFATNDINNKDFIGLANFKTKRTTLGRYTNHSNDEKANIKFSILDSENIVAFAIKNIKKNEEILINYRHDYLINKT